VVTSLPPANTAQVASDYAYQRLFVEATQPQGTLYNLDTTNVTALPPPLIDVAGTKGLMQQGVFQQGGTPDDLGMPTSMLLDTVCQGDELLLACVKNQTPLDRPHWTANWQFVDDTSDDAWFSFLFGQGHISPSALTPKPDIGVYVMVGVTQ
jgi:hypothetical protein